MPTTITLEDGPYAGTLDFPQPPGDGIGLPVDEQLNRTKGSNPFAYAIYQRQQRAGNDVYVLARYQRKDNQPFPIHFVDGPAAGYLPAPQPAQHLDPEQRVYLTPEGTQYQGRGEPAGVAVYERREADGRFFYALREIDSSPETVRAAIEAINEERLTEAIGNFYASPDYDIYSMKPTGEHVQVPVEVGHRRGHVDEGIASLIGEVWRLGLDTLGSCQERPPGSSNAGKAYLGFPRMRDARFFYQRLSEAEIPATFAEKKLEIANKPNPDASALETFELDSANVLFDPNDIERIVNLFRGL